MSSSSGYGTDDCGRTSATSRPSTMPSPRSTRPSESRARRSSASEEDAQDERTREAFFIVQPRRAELEEIARLIDAGQVRPVVGAEFPLADAVRAYQTKPLRGKVVLRVDGDG